MSAEYWVWLQQVLGYSNCAVARVISEYKTAKAFYNADDSEKIKRCRLTKSQISRLNNISRRVIYNILNECKESGISIITPESELYPERLLNIEDPPAVLYVKGSWFNINDKPVISIVGPRKISDYGDKCAYVISNTLASCGFIIVSGGAVGGDSAAHLGAIDELKPTVAVLGCGINSNYLKVNKDLRNRIMANGCLVSEYPPSYGASKITFPQRNRIMSGLSNGVVVVEGGIKSGTLITAKCASEQGKDVFVIPGSPSEECYYGSNRLIYDGARPLLNINDIIKEYYPLYKDKIELPKKETEMPLKSNLSVSPKIKSKTNTFNKPMADTDSNISKSESTAMSNSSRQVYDTALKIGKDFTPDDIVEESLLSISDVLSSLIELEILGLIQSSHGGRYSVKF